MKADEEFGPDRGMEFQTDDEENRAETLGESEEDYESDFTFSDRNPSECSSLSFHMPWPQSYRQSMDMLTSVTPPKVGFLGGTSLTGLGSSFLSSSVYKRAQASESNASLAQPFISVTNAIEKVDELPLPETATPKRSSSYYKASFHELPPPAQQCSYTQSVVNGVNVLCGVGLLSTPFAVKEGGWISLLILFGFSIISCYTGVLLKRCLDSSSGLKTYPDIGQAAFGVSGRLFIAIILYIELYVCCVEFITLMGDNMSKMFPNAQMVFMGIHLNSHYFFTILMTIILLPTILLRNLSLLSYLSGGGVVASLLVVLCLLWVGVVDQVGFHPGGAALDIANIPVSLGIYGFCYAGHSVFPNLYSSMEKPSDFSTVLLVSFSICCLLYTGVAICGFMMFGYSIQSQFTLNMPQEFVASKIAVWTAVVNPLSKYALTLTPVALSLEELLPPSRLRSHYVSVFIRMVLVASTLVVALAVPFFAFVMALVGSFLTMLIALIFPCACYLSILRGRLKWPQIAVCIFIIVVGIVCSCIGTYSAAKKIVDQMG
ncbi:amino acid transporter AVT1G-like [Macadamia integrifolia]|uniref:amino acid transporter AVT1G-like n=1 Tax=Macadamia integrifolia TaxID=60698 RepID=UPI001C52A2F2|nr:amino acid transporter AVT1G-like [Macadamia integrifolia]